MDSASDHDLISLMHQMLMNGAARWQIEQAIAEQHSAGKMSQMPSKEEIDEAYAAVVENWIADADQDPAQAHAYHLALRKSLLTKSIVIKDYPTAARIAQDLAKLQDQYQTAKASTANRPARQSRIERLRGRKPSLRVVDR